VKEDYQIIFANNLSSSSDGGIVLQAPHGKWEWSTPELFHYRDSRNSQILPK